MDIHAWGCRMKRLINSTSCNDGIDILHLSWSGSLLRASSKFFTWQWNQWLPSKSCNRQLLTLQSGAKAISEHHISHCCCYMYWQDITTGIWACLITVQKSEKTCIAYWNDLDLNALNTGLIYPSGVYRGMVFRNWSMRSVAPHKVVADSSLQALNTSLLSFFYSRCDGYNCELRNL